MIEKRTYFYNVFDTRDVKASRTTVMVATHRFMQKQCLQTCVHGGIHVIQTCESQMAGSVLVL